jgi:NDP-sugar pyrophosphorylase family protein
MIVFPMAGLSRRFTEAGYTKPKFMLNLKGQTLFAHSVASFDAYFHKEPFLFIARDETGYKDFIESEVKKLGIENFAISMLPRMTDGQAETVQLGLETANVSLETPVTIFNIDTFRPNFRYPDRSWMKRADGYLEVMAGCSDPGFSYVRPFEPDEDGRVAETAEKIVISDLASTGLYWFAQAGLFLEAFKDRNSALAHGELYVAPIYNAMIKKGMDVRYEIVPSEEVIFCGTPQQYHELLEAP